MTAQPQPICDGECAGHGNCSCSCGAGAEVRRLQAEVEALKERLDTIHNADVLILLYNKGRSGGAFIKGIEGQVPMKSSVDYGEADDPPLTLRHVTCHAGWTRAQWRKMDRTGLHGGAGASEGQATA